MIKKECFKCCFDEEKRKILNLKLKITMCLAIMRASEF